jgi:hypothetical protein
MSSTVILESGWVVMKGDVGGKGWDVSPIASSPTATSSTHPTAPGVQTVS